MNIGRPTSLNRNNVSEVCLHIYWKKGINNISYNDVIKASKLSKGSYYKLFDNEDDLHSETLINYRNNDVKLLFHELSNAEDLFQFLSILKNWKFKNDMKYCYFFVACVEKYRVGIKTRKTISNIESKYKLLLGRITKKHIEKHDIKISNLNIKQIANFIFNGLLLINLLYRNKSSQANINSYKKSIHQFISNLHVNKDNYIV